MEILPRIRQSAFTSWVGAIGWALLAGAALSTGCGYHLQGTANPLIEKEGIQRIYVSSVSNNSYKPGVETVVYNSLVRSLRAHGRVILVQSPVLADAILTGVVGGASYGGSASAAVTSLKPNTVGNAPGFPTAGFPISTEYTATLSCSFALTVRTPRPGRKGVVWSGGFSRSKPFPAANQLDVPGTTSALINDSEFDRAILDLSHSMMDDVNESMLAMF